MIELTLGTKEALKLYRRLKENTSPVVKGFREKLESKLFEKIEELENQSDD